MQAQTHLQIHALGEDVGVGGGVGGDSCSRVFSICCVRVGGGAALQRPGERGRWRARERERARDARERVSVSEESGGEGPQEGSRVEALRPTAQEVTTLRRVPNLRVCVSRPFTPSESLLFLH